MMTEEQIKAAYTKLQEESGSKFGSILMQAINSFCLLTVKFWEMLIHPVADRWHEQSLHILWI